MAFGSDDEREQELARLAGLSDDAFAATEAAYERMSLAQSIGAREESKPAGVVETKSGAAEADDKSRAASQEQHQPLRSDAGVRPREVDDRKSSLEDQLREGFMAAYKRRIAQNKGDLAVS